MWDARFRELVVFIEEHGHAMVPLSGTELGSWVGTQRRLRKQGKLLEHRRQKLELIGFVWNVLDQKWNDKYNALLRFQKDNGHARVPHSHPLSSWVQSQRMQHKKGKLPEWRYAKLQQMGFCWNVAQWNFEHHIGLVRNETANGTMLWDIKVPDGPLGLWVSHQKREYRKYRFNQTTTLSTTKIDMLEDAGFSFTMIDTNHTRDPTDHDWNERMKQLRAFKDHHGHTNVPRTHSQLGPWVAKVRERMNPFMLNLPEAELQLWRNQNERWERDWQRLLDLQQVGFIWDVYEWRWQNKFRELVDYRQQHGHCNVPFTQGTLGTWVGAQRAEFLKIQQGQASRLTMQRARALSSIGFEFVRKDTVRKQQSHTYQQRTDEYNSWKQKNLPKSSMEKSLRYWIDAQRRIYRKFVEGDNVPNTFTHERRLLLESTGIVDDLMIEEDSV